jgi:DNA-directed RNA polymerase specialized sigma24 family protein
MADPNPYPPARGDEAELFRQFNADLMRSINGAVFVSTPSTIEDACAFAWAEFLKYQPSREINWKGWLFRTAQREAWRIERSWRDPDNHLMRNGDDVECRDPRGSVVESIEIRHDVEEALQIIAQLEPRLQRVALLRAFKYGYEQIAEVTGDSLTRVHHLATRADGAISEMLMQRRNERAALPPRAARLWELEQDPPEWLLAKIGPLPKALRKVAGRPLQQRQWRRAAIALDDYRQLTGAEGFEAMTTEPPANPALKAPHAKAVQAMSELLALRNRELAREP